MVIVTKVVPTLWLLTSVCSLPTEQVDTNVTTLYPIHNTPNKTTQHTESTKNHQIWKLESSFIESNITEEDFKLNKTEDKEHKTLDDLKENELNSKDDKVQKDKQQDFKPSQHLGSFFDEESAEVIKTPSLGVLGKKPSGGIISSQKHHYLPPYKTRYKPFPYKFESTAAKEWDSSATPTVEAPTRVPAGGFYQFPDAFKERPLSGEEFALEVVDEKEHLVKKRVSPWHDLLRLATAFIPVGLLISALTPNVVTIQNVDAPVSNPFRRSELAAPVTTPISERCRRRLLCELHSERNYTPSSAGRSCYKLHCEDTEALWKVLQWMFSYKLRPDRTEHFT